MDGLKVETEVLRASARALSEVAAAAAQVGDGHAHLNEVIWAVGSIPASQGLDSFLCAWTYGVRCIAKQAAEVGRELTTSAMSYEAAETALTAAASGGNPVPVLAGTPVTVPFEEPLCPAPRVIAPQVPVQLAAAKYVRDLIPGDPEEVSVAGRLMMRFAEDLGDARMDLTRVSLGTWEGAAANVVRHDLEELLGRLSKAEEAFLDAGSAVGVYARKHADAQEDVARALAMWQSAKPASDAAHGALVGAAPVGGPDDPDTVLARAGALARDAEERFIEAGRALKDILIRAEEGHPKSPGILSTIRRAARSIGLGLTDDVTGVVESAVTLAKLAVRLDPARGIYDPDGYADTLWSLETGVAHVVTHPLEAGAAVIDLETWEDAPDARVRADPAGPHRAGHSRQGGRRRPQN